MLISWGGGPAGPVGRGPLNHAPPAPGAPEAARRFGILSAARALRRTRARLMLWLNNYKFDVKNDQEILPVVVCKREFCIKKLYQ